jgi:hypothetical protein
MHFRRLAALLIGALLATGAFIDFTAIQNFRAVDRFLGAPATQAIPGIQTLGQGAARTLLRRQVAETNRFLFEKSEQCQILLGLAFVLALAFARAHSPRLPIILGVLILFLLALEHFYLSPEITELGRKLDSTGASKEVAAVFWRFHGTYSAVELLKLAFGLVAGVSLVFGGPRHARATEFADSLAESSRG